MSDDMTRIRTFCLPFETQNVQYLIEVEKSSPVTRS